MGKSKIVEKTKTKQDLDFVFITDCQLESEIEISDIINSPCCLQKGTPNEIVGISGKAPNLSNTKTPSLGGYNIEDFTTRVVAIKAFFMSEIYYLKHEIQSQNRIFV